ncbi:uridine nucleosidase 1-like isoform X1 [Telopea speciosissima]|uniref:uridine nucleosidase 1-like isoform X1 n=1 Tax=Telopea speciosissima TaxID=54955 RepID=UPI001CC67745|nr:uridine nucleosidase 1-like isoform X1 [Telopea speciosissima]
MESVTSNSHDIADTITSFSSKPEKIIIDTDPGIDDSMAIFMAFQTPEVEVLGLTTIFGNVSTAGATRNALLLCELAGCPGIPVAEGSSEPLKGGIPSVADFVHGPDGLGNVSLPPPKEKKIEKSATEFLVDKVSEYPGEVSILALGPLTNLALAIKRDSSFASKVKRLVILGGAFFALGNVNPAAEANIYGDPEAADIVFTSGANIIVVGINITTQVKLTDEDLSELRDSKGRNSHFLGELCKFYRDWHVKSDGVCDGTRTTLGQAMPPFQSHGQLMWRESLCILRNCSQSHEAIMHMKPQEVKVGLSTIFHFDNPFSLLYICHKYWICVSCIGITYLNS